MAVARQFKTDRPAVTARLQCPKGAREIDLPLPRQEVLVHPAPHVLQVHLYDLVSVGPADRHRVAFPFGVEVADVEGHRRCVIAERIPHRPPLRNGGYGHAGLGLQRRLQTVMAHRGTCGPHTVEQTRF